MRTPTFHPVATSWNLQQLKSSNESFSRSPLHFDTYLIAASHHISTAC
jgi:hypothetical protein